MCRNTEKGTCTFYINLEKIKKDIFYLAFFHWRKKMKTFITLFTLLIIQFSNAGEFKFQLANRVLFWEEVATTKKTKIKSFSTASWSLHYGPTAFELNEEGEVVDTNILDLEASEIIKERNPNNEGKKQIAFVNSIYDVRNTRDLEAGQIFLFSNNAKKTADKLLEEYLIMFRDDFQKKMTLIHNNNNDDNEVQITVDNVELFTKSALSAQDVRINYVQCHLPFIPYVNRKCEAVLSGTLFVRYEVN